MKIWSRGVLVPFWVAGGAKVGSRTARLESSAAKINFLNKKVILEVPKIENGTKTDRWRQDRHRDPLNMLSGSGFEKT